jgi:hypothetical protein
MDVQLSISDPVALAISIFGVVISAVYLFIRLSSCARKEDYDTELKKELDEWLDGDKTKPPDCQKVEVLLKDYETATSEIARRDNVALIVGTILVTSSLLIFATYAGTNPISIYAFASIGLFSVWIWLLHYTGSKLDDLSYDRIKAIEEALKDRLGYKFGIFSYIFSRTYPKNKCKPVLWLRFRRIFGV